MSKKQKREVRIVETMRYAYPPNEEHISFEWSKDGRPRRATIVVKDEEDVWEQIAKHLDSDWGNLVDQVREV